MYSILIADDEKIIRDGMKCLFDYEALGFEIIAEAANGLQAYEKMVALQPDVVLLDIRMPQMSGLDAVKKARANGFRGKVVIVSSFSDFSYAQEAIRCGVQNYITKPIDEDELREIFLQFRQELSTAAVYHPQDSLLNDLLLGKPPILSESIMVVICQQFEKESVCDVERFAQMLRITGMNSGNLEQIAQPEYTVFLLKGDVTIQKMEELIQRCCAADDPFLPYFIACGRKADTPAEALQSYRDACLLVQQRFFAPSGRHVQRHTMVRSEHSECTVLNGCLLEEYTQKLLQFVQTFNRKMVAATLQELEDQILLSSENVDAIRLFFTDLYLQIKERMHHLYPENTIPFYSNSHIIQTIQQATYLSDITCFLAQRFDMIMSSIGTSSRDSVLDDILHYIQHNYAGNLTLESIAPLFGYNHSYLGKIFRKKMGCSFNAYVDHVRIEKAKELLLQDDAKVYTVSERVGYKNVDYFHMKFRKYVNQSPAEFRKANKDISSSPEGNLEKGSLF